MFTWCHGLPSDSHKYVSQLITIHTNIPPSVSFLRWQRPRIITLFTDSNIAIKSAMTATLTRRRSLLCCFCELLGFWAPSAGMRLMLTQTAQSDLTSVCVIIIIWNSRGDTRSEASLWSQINVNFNKYFKNIIGLKVQCIFLWDFNQLYNQSKLNCKCSYKIQRGFILNIFWMLQTFVKLQNKIT